MIKCFKKILIFLFFSFLLFTFISNPSLIINSVNYSTQIFINNVLPSLLPFFILADILINYGYVNVLDKIFKFKYSYLMLLSLFSGLPSNAKYIGSLLDKSEISLNDANIMLSVTLLPNPMFVIGTIGVSLLNNIKYGIFILLSVYLSNFLVYLFYYKKLSKKNLQINLNKESFSSLMKNSILKNASALTIILGSIVIFTTLSNIIFNYVSLPKTLEAIITGIFEMTSGIKKMSVLNIRTHFKVLLISLNLTMSGISVLCQAFSILSEFDINYKFILKNKILIMFLNFLINYAYIIIT